MNSPQLPTTSVRQWPDVDVATDTFGGAATSIAWRLAMVAVFCVLFDTIYVRWASELYAEYGLIFGGSTRGWMPLAVIATIAVALPRSFKRWSDLVQWVLYIVVFVPSVLTVSMQQFRSFDADTLIAVLSLSFLVMTGIARVRVLPAAPASAQAKALFKPVFLTGYSLLVAVVLFSFRDVFSLAAFDDVGDQRAAFGSAGVLGVAVYALNFLAYALNPYLIARGVADRSWRWGVPVGLLCQVLAYAASAGRVILVASFFSLALALAAKRQKSFLGAAAFMLGPVTALGLVSALLIMDDFKASGQILYFSSLVYMRTFAIQGALTGVYADFFADHPWTYGSHIHGVHLMVHYPYDKPLAYVIGTELVGGAGFGANAHFWATDGIAGFGLAGVPMIGAVAGVIWAIGDRLIPREVVPFAMSVTLPFAMGLSNNSLFTSMITGGGALVLLLCYVGAPELRAADDPQGR